MYDRSGNGNRGTLSNGPVRTVGKLGQALQFDGSNDYVDAGDKDAFTITSSGFTVAGWIRADTLPVGSTRMFAIGKGAAGSYEWAVSINDATSGGDYTGKLNMTYWPSHGSLGMSRRSATTIAAGTWYYFVYTVGGTTATPNVYIRVHPD
jgi:Concanavalin A-like lectin/glucanases superfamily